MRKVLLLTLITAAVVSPVALADTLHLKNGSILKGKVTSFADDQFTVMIDTGSGRYMSKATVYMGDVARIEFDTTPASAGETANASSQPAEPPARISEPPVSEPKLKTSSSEVTSRNTQPQETAREVGPPDSPPASKPASPPDSPPAKEPEPAASEKVESKVIAPTAPPNVPVSDTGEGERLTRKPTGPVKTVTVDVVGKRDWTSTGLIVKRGDRIRISASGTVILDPTSGRSAGPEGITDIPDPKKLVPDQPTGALIGVIGADNDDFIFIGKATEFTAARDGLLFLSVNEGNLADNTGTYKAVIEVQGQRAR
jgi:hypothetical protein